MTRLLLLLILCTALLSNTHAQSFEWVNEAGWIGQDAGRSVDVDTAGNVYVTGYFAGKADFFGDAFLAGQGTFEFFLVKYTSSGEMLWIRHGGSVDRDAGNAVTVDSAGNAYVTGYFSGTATFGNQTITSRGSHDIFIAKYNTDGELLWLKTAGGIDEDRGFGIKYDRNDGIYITGFFKGTAFFDGESVQSNGSNDIFIARYDTNGVIQWVRGIGDAGVDNGLDVSVDAKGNAYVAGLFYYAANFGNNISLTGRGLSSEGFVARYTPAGVCDRAKLLGGPFTDAAYAVDIDFNNNIFVTGYFLDTAHFESSTLIADGYNDVFLVKYDTSWQEEWVRGMGGPYLDIGTSVSTDKQGNVYVTGSYDSLSNFQGAFLDGPPEDQEIFVAKYSSKGGLFWAMKAGGEEGDFGNDIVVDKFGNIFITGLYYFRATFGTITARGTSRDKPFIFTAKLSPFSTGIGSTIEAGGFLLYPNPNSGNFNLSIPYTMNGPVNISLIDMQGKTLARENVLYPSGEIELNWGHVHKGYYLVKLQTATQVHTRPMVIH